ncbi:Uncharacterised protein [Cedecea neteri]|uniref:Uncharacterized protein n=1 Tax=Cedecea neteri TaxID=158822 RepID=A0A2X3IIJ1_9ENTR|nr:Uncharacterised protein [Cedecea neteri]
MGQDHQGIKRIAKSAPGFKSLGSAEATIVGIALHRMLKKEQHGKYRRHLSLEAVVYISSLTMSGIRLPSIL